MYLTHTAGGLFHYQMLKKSMGVKSIMSMPRKLKQAPRLQTFFMLNSAEHEISNVHKYKIIKKFSFYKAQISLECYFSLLINV